jgi:hypothetical protein
MPGPLRTATVRARLDLESRLSPLAPSSARLYDCLGLLGWWALNSYADARKPTLRPSLEVSWKEMYTYAMPYPGLSDGVSCLLSSCLAHHLVVRACEAQAFLNLLSVGLRVPDRPVDAGTHGHSRTAQASVADRRVSGRSSRFRRSSHRPNWLATQTPHATLPIRGRVCDAGDIDAQGKG